jgi:hypothetical protein
MKRYTSISKIKSLTGKEMYATVRYPEIPRSFEDIYVYTTAGDRFDTLAQQYYNNSSFWWVISLANDNLKQDSLTPPIGIQIRIPSNPIPIISAYKNLNESLNTSTTNVGSPNNAY